ncbi:MAG: hypothetical protein QM756_19915 [Polyangiaceae bacterium]
MQRARLGVRNQRLRTGFASSLLLAACALDQRTLEPSNSTCQGSASCSSSGGNLARGGNANAGLGSGGNDNGGAAGDGTQVGPTVDCPDLNQNTVPDCTETLVENSAFDHDSVAWTPGANAAVKWDSLDARGSNQSGTLRVENRSSGSALDGGLVSTGALQCVPIEPNHAYDLFVQMYSRGPTISGYASVVGRVFASSDCTGSPLRVETSPIQGTIDLWITLQATVPAEASAGSMLIELSVGRLSTMTGPVSVVFDNVLLR